MSKVALLVLAAFLMFATSALAAPTSAEVIVTAKDSGDRMTSKGTVPFAPLAQPEEAAISVIIDPTRCFQVIEGIGGAFTDASAETFDKLPKVSQEEFIRAYFDPVRGIGYTLGRTHIHSCDFSSESYTYVKDGDASLASFSIARDRQHRIPFIRRILAAAPGLRMFASPWSPPGWMKTNGEMLHGGKLERRYYEAWARYFVRFVKAYAAEGIPMWGLTVQNEPMAVQTWESCIFTAEDERDFVKGFLGPALAAAGLGDLKLMIWDHNRGLMYQRAATVLTDPEAAKYVWGIAFHWYVGEMYRNESAVHDAFPDKAIFFSEGCNGPFDAKGLDDWKWGESYGRSMINDFNNWTCGWTDWNVLLDETGGPNHVKNFCFAPVHADTRTGTLHYTNAFWYIGHFSKYVRLGARRIAATSTSDDILTTAFVNADGRVATVVMNATDAPKAVNVWVAGKAAKVSLPAHAIATVLW